METDRVLAWKLLLTATLVGLHARGSFSDTFGASCHENGRKMTWKLCWSEIQLWNCRKCS